MPREEGSITIRNAEILYANFSGVQLRYNNEGKRNFCVILDEETATRLAEDGWNVKATKPREEGDESRPYIQVTVGYNYRPPKVVLITSKGRTDLDESMVGLVDSLVNDLRQADMIVRGVHWKQPTGESGIKAYLKSLFITPEEDELDLEYGDVPYANQTPGEDD